MSSIWNFAAEGGRKPRMLRAILLASVVFALGCDDPPPPVPTGPDINVAGVESPLDAELFRASSGDDPEAVVSRLDDGANVNVTNNLGRTPLFAAAFHGRVEVARVLIEKGANLAVRDGSGLTPLHAAVLGGSAEMTDLLLASGADANVRSVAGMTPLHLAAATGQIELAKALLARGADKSIRDGQGQTPAGLAEANRHPATLALIQKAQHAAK